jgi:hypothetical protein
MGPFTVHRGSGRRRKESEWLEIRGHGKATRCHPRAARRRAIGDCPQSGLKVRWRGAGNGPSRKPKRCDLGTENRRTRAPQGEPTGPEQGLREPDEALRRRATDASGPVWRSAQGRREAPAYPSPPRPARRGGRRVGNGHWTGIRVWFRTGDQSSVSRNGERAWRDELGAPVLVPHSPVASVHCHRCAVLRTANRS